MIQLISKSYTEVNVEVRQGETCSAQLWKNVRTAVRKFMDRGRDFQRVGHTSANPAPVTRKGSASTGTPLLSFRPPLTKFHNDERRSPGSLHLSIVGSSHTSRRSSDSGGANDVLFSSHQGNTKRPDAPLHADQMGLRRCPPEVGNCSRCYHQDAWLRYNV